MISMFRFGGWIILSLWILAFIGVFLGAAPKFAVEVLLSGWFFYPFLVLTLVFFIAGNIVLRCVRAEITRFHAIKAIERSAMFIAIVFWMVVHSPLSGQ